MISVVIPAYNAERTITACLNALNTQTMQRAEYELIVVDDGSTDDTAAVAEKLGATVCRQAQRGPAAARNLGIGAARGELVLFTDADCEPAPDWIENMCAPLRDERVVGVKGAYATRQMETLARLGQLEFEERYDRLERQHFVDFFDTHACALRMSALRAMGAFDTFFPNNEDVDLAYRFHSRGSRLVFNRCAVVYHSHPATWRQYARQKFWRGYWRLQVYCRYPGKMITDSYTPHSLKLQIVLMAVLLMSALVAPLWPPTLWAVALLALALIGSALSLFAVAWRRDRAVLPLILVFVAVRALAIGSGIALGVLTILRIAPVLRPHARYG